MFLLCQLPILSTIWFVSDEHRVHYRWHLAGDGHDGFTGPMLPFDSLVEFPHSRVVLSSGLSALSQNPSCPLAAFSCDVSCPLSFTGLVGLRREAYPADELLV